MLHFKCPTLLLSTHYVKHQVLLFVINNSDYSVLFQVWKSYIQDCSHLTDDLFGPYLPWIGKTSTQKWRTCYGSGEQNNAFIFGGTTVFSLLIISAQFVVQQWCWKKWKNCEKVSVNNIPKRKHFTNINKRTKTKYVHRSLACKVRLLLSGFNVDQAILHCTSSVQLISW